MALVFDPSTGVYLNPATGAASLDPNGTQAINDPSLITQAKRNLAVSHGLLDTLGKYGQQFDSSITGEQALAQHLNDVIAGTAPSVAQGQLEQGLGQIRQQQESEASGATGANAALARQNAMANTGTAQAQANQSASLLRATEEANAERNEGAVLGNIAGQSSNMYGTNVGAASQFSGQAGNEATTQAQIDAQKSEENRRLIANLVAAGGGAAAVLATGGAAAPAVAQALAGMTAGQAGNSASKFAGDVTAGLPDTTPSTGATNEDLIGPSPSTVPGASATHTMVNDLSPSYNGPDVNPTTGESETSAYTSDRREKTDVKAAPMEDFLNKLAGYTYDYKHVGSPGENPGTRIGPMAQDAQKSAVGRSMVVDGHPLKMDIPNAVGGALAACAYLNSEIKKLKAGRQ